MKNILICSDGTGNEYGENNTNVVLAYALAIKDDTQLTLYDPGIGTGGWEYDEGTGVLRAKADQATGHGLQKNVEDAYRFLMARYEAGDRVFLLGFSRGAFTVRSLAGMLYKVGLLMPDHDNLVEYASKVYNTAKNEEIARGFKRTFSRECPVYFVGVWDTVESLVLNAGRRFHDTTLNSEVEFGYHAVAVDERRKDFPPCLWDQSRVLPGQTIEQVWFPGAHADVGGWHPERGLSNTALAWMLGKAKERGLKVDDAGLGRYAGDPHGTLHESYSGFWKFRGSRTRKIPEGALIHRSVMDRMNRPANKYRPKNLPGRYEVVD